MKGRKQEDVCEFHDTQIYIIERTVSKQTHTQENNTAKKLKKEEMIQELGMAADIYNPSSKKRKGKRKFQIT